MSSASPKLFRCFLTIHVGPSTSPFLDVLAESLQRIFIIISPPPCAASNQCVMGYTITATSSNGTVLPDITVASDGQGIVTLSESCFDLCDNVYNFTAVANTLTGPGDMSEVVSPEVGHFISEFKPRAIIKYTGMRIIQFTN